MTRRRSWHGARCLVTGASSGLGRALAERLVRAGASVALTGRSVERLQGVAQGLINSGFDPAAIIPIPADLTVYEDRERLFAKLADHFNALDLVVNTRELARPACLKLTITMCSARSLKSTSLLWRRSAGRHCRS